MLDHIHALVPELTWDMPPTGTHALVLEPYSLVPHGVSEGGVLDHIPTGTHAVDEHTLDKGNTHLSWDIHQTRDNYSSLDM